MTFQIRKFLCYLNIPWANDIKLPPEPDYTPKRITREAIRKAIEYFRNHRYFPQIKALILLGASSGLRAEEIYQLEPRNIDLEKRMVYVIHDPENGKTTKTGKSRITFFNEEAQEAMKEYFQFFDRSGLKKLFGKTHLEELFKDAPIRVKDLRKFFSQEWECLNGSYAVKELLLGHSTKGKVDLQHYTYLSPEDLKKIYDKVGIKILN
ncbi:MAG: tyrosine-type recombinase/integrase [Thermoplasmata archaeon]|nr:tyrosine-type recombinase/integrase [Thermoplasmata archaeon]